jgi:hypothetical protein
LLCGGHPAHATEQHRLAHASQPGQDHAALGKLALQAAEHHAKLLELAIAPDQRPRRRPGARRVGIQDRVHGGRGL